MHKSVIPLNFVHRPHVAAIHLQCQVKTNITSQIKTKFHPEQIMASQEQKVCFVCKTSVDNKYDLGDWVTCGDITAHYFCLVMKFKQNKSKMKRCLTKYHSFTAVCIKTGTKW